MTRFLSESLNSSEPSFREALSKLEDASGNPSADIRLSVDIMRQSEDKLRQLGLDPKDTTASELYEALKQKVKDDDQALARHLRTLAATHVNAEADPIDGMIEALKRSSDSKRCFALKLSKLKSLFKANPPKKALKSLHYRSLDSMLKHEQPVLILAAAWLNESSAWRKRLLEQYKKLKASDFEDRSIAFINSPSPAWKSLTDTLDLDANQHLMWFSELGAVVFLPFTDVHELKSGSITANFALALKATNEIRSASSFLKINQVKPDFGQKAATIAESEPSIKFNLMDEPVSWGLLQRYYTRLSDMFHEDIFEPYLEKEDMLWQEVENSLSELEPSFAFWKGTAHLGTIQQDKQPLSFNLIDNVLNVTNQLPFEKRVVKFFRESLWSELLMRYIKHQHVEQAVLNELQPELAEVGS